MTFNISKPPIKTPFDKDGKVSVEWVAWVNQVQTILNTTVQSGITADRPTKKFIGQQFYDTTIDLPIHVNAAGTGWEDAAGNSV